MCINGVDGGRRQLVEDGDPDELGVCVLAVCMCEREPKSGAWNDAVCCVGDDREEHAVGLPHRQVASNAQTTLSPSREQRATARDAVLPARERERRRLCRCRRAACLCPPTHAPPAADPRMRARLQRSAGPHSTPGAAGRVGARRRRAQASTAMRPHRARPTAASRGGHRSRTRRRRPVAHPPIWCACAAAAAHARRRRRRQHRAGARMVPPCSARAGSTSSTSRARPASVTAAAACRGHAAAARCAPAAGAPAPTHQPAHAAAVPAATAQRHGPAVLRAGTRGRGGHAGCLRHLFGGSGDGSSHLGASTAASRRHAHGRWLWGRLRRLLLPERMSHRGWLNGLRRARGDGRSPRWRSSSRSARSARRARRVVERAARPTTAPARRAQQRRRRRQRQRQRRCRQRQRARAGARPGRRRRRERRRRLGERAVRPRGRGRRRAAAAATRRPR